jgi:hypothetical protein
VFFIAFGAFHNDMPNIGIAQPFTTNITAMKKSRTAITISAINQGDIGSLVSVSTEKNPIRHLKGVLVDFAILKFAFYNSRREKAALHSIARNFFYP